MSTSLNSSPGRLGAPSSLSSSSSGSDGGAAGAFLLVMLALGSLFLLQGEGNQRILLTACIAATLFALLAFAPLIGVCSSLIFLSVLGGIKRWLVPTLGYVPNDPLMTVGPIIIGLPFIQRIIRRDIPHDTPISKLVLALFLLMVLQMFNPQQGGIMVGVSGAMFYIVPMFWFYYARANGTPQMLRTLIRCSLGIAFILGLYGQYQQFFGFLESEKLWMRYTNWTLGVSSSATKVFSTYCSTAEYSQFLGMGMVLCFVGVLRKQTLSVLFFLAFALMILLSGNRGIVLTSLAACSVIWAVQGTNTKAWLPRLILSGAFAVFALIFGLNSIKTASVGNDVARDMIQHQIDGLANPIKKVDASGAAHANLVMGGVLYGLKHPIGGGLGATTMGGAKFADGSQSDAFSTETDFSNAFVSLGLLGGIIYLVLMFQILRALLRRWAETRSHDVLAFLGILVCQLGLWLMGSHYAEMVLIWVCIGVIDRMDSIDKAIKSAKEASEEAAQKALTGDQQRESLPAAA